MESNLLPEHAASTSGVPTELENCIQHLQQANLSLLQLVKKRDRELEQARNCLVRLAQLLVPNHPLLLAALARMGSPEGMATMDQMVSDIANRFLTDRSS